MRTTATQFGELQVRDELIRRAWAKGLQDMNEGSNAGELRAHKEP
ncbi:MAG TPA: hypothetical protein VI136_13255 [Verrucomicrobiae bacterium]